MTLVSTGPVTDAAAAAPVTGVDLLSPSVRAADAAAHGIRTLLADQGALEGAVIATHLTGLGPVPHATLSVRAPALTEAALGDLLLRALPGAVLGVVPGPTPGDARSDQPGPVPAMAAAVAGAAAHAAGTAGRAVHFPGVDRLVGTLRVDEVLMHSAIDDVVLMGVRRPADPQTPLVTRDHVRPSYDGGRLVLLVERAAGGTLVPFETPNPTPCCADHA